MPQLYGRQIKVTVAGLIVDHPRISFEVQRTADQTQTTGHVKLLQPDRRPGQAHPGAWRADCHRGGLSGDHRHSL